MSFQYQSSDVFNLPTTGDQLFLINSSAAPASGETGFQINGTDIVYLFARTDQVESNYYYDTGTSINDSFQSKGNSFESIFFKNPTLSINVHNTTLNTDIPHTCVCNTAMYSGSSNADGNGRLYEIDTGSNATVTIYPNSKSVEVHGVLVGGGGGGGSDYSTALMGGGGGGGEVIWFRSKPSTNLITSNNLSFNITTGGSVDPNANGNNSTFSMTNGGSTSNTITAKGGGKGGNARLSSTSSSGGSGGCGGGSGALKTYASATTGSSFSASLTNFMFYSFRTDGVLGNDTISGSSKLGSGGSGAKTTGNSNGTGGTEQALYVNASSSDMESIILDSTTLGAGSFPLTQRVHSRLKPLEWVKYTAFSDGGNSSTSPVASTLYGGGGGNTIGGNAGFCLLYIRLY